MRVFIKNFFTILNKLTENNKPKQLMESIF